MPKWSDDGHFVLIVALLMALPLFVLSTFALRSWTMFGGELSPVGTVGVVVLLVIMFGSMASVIWPLPKWGWFGQVVSLSHRADTPSMPNRSGSDASSTHRTVRESRTHRRCRQQRA